MFKLQKILALLLLLTVVYGLTLRGPAHQATHSYVHDVGKVCQCPPEYPYDDGK